MVARTIFGTALVIAAWASGPAGAGAQSDAGVDAGTETEAETETEEARRAEARRLFEQGVQYSNKERWGEALQYFRRSRELVERPSTLFNIGVALLRLGRPTEALRVLDDYLRVAGPESDRRDEARRMLEAAMQSSARLTIGVEPANAEVLVDGEPVGGGTTTRELRVDPGEHVLEASAEGHANERRRVSLLPGESKTEWLRLERAPEGAEAGRVSITSNVADATIRIDGEVVGEGTWNGHVTSGRHRVEVDAAGYDRFERVVEVDTGGTVEMHAALRVEEVPVTRKPAFWIATVSAAVAVGVGIALGVTLGGTGTEQPYGGNTGVVVQGLRIGD